MKKSKESIVSKNNGSGLNTNKTTATVSSVSLVDIKKAKKRAYDKSFNGYILRAYGHMKQRVNGKSKPHIYKGLPLLDKAEFIAWASKNSVYKKLHAYWVETGYKRKYSPSIDRKDSTKGYTLDNIQWVTQSVNSIQGNKSPLRKIFKRLKTNLKTA